MDDWATGEDGRQAEWREEGIHRLAGGPKRPQAGPSLPKEIPAVEVPEYVAARTRIPRCDPEIRSHQMGREGIGWWWTCPCGDEAGPFGVWELADTDAIDHARGGA
jgi:hypothetical protein